jgi:hypothetical protein
MFGAMQATAPSIAGTSTAVESRRAPYGGRWGYITGIVRPITGSVEAA